MDNEQKIKLIQIMLDLFNNPDRRVTDKELVELGLTDEVIVDITTEAFEWYKQFLAVENGFNLSEESEENSDDQTA